VTKNVAFLGTILSLAAACGEADPASPFRNPGSIGADGAATGTDETSSGEPTDPTQQRGTVIVPRLETGPIPADPEDTGAPTDGESTPATGEEASSDLLDATSQPAPQSTAEPSQGGASAMDVSEAGPTEEPDVAAVDMTVDMAPEEPAPTEPPVDTMVEAEPPVDEPSEPTNPVECPAERPVDNTSCNLELGVNCFFDDLSCRCPFGGWACVDAAEIVNLPNRDVDGNLVNPEGCPATLDAGTACQAGVTCVYGALLCNCDGSGMTCAAIP